MLFLKFLPNSRRPLSQKEETNPSQKHIQHLWKQKVCFASASWVTQSGESQCHPCLCVTRHHTRLDGKTHYMLLSGVDSHLPPEVSQLLETGADQAVIVISIHQPCHFKSASLDPWCFVFFMWIQCLKVRVIWSCDWGWSEVVTAALHMAGGVCSCHVSLEGYMCCWWSVLGHLLIAGMLLRR